MPLEFVFPFLEIKFENDYMEFTWKRSPSEIELKDGLEKGLELAKEHDIKKWLANTKLIGELPPLINDWMNENWFPRVILQIQKMAIIIPTSALAMMNVNQIMSRVGKLESKYFDSIENAKKWL